MIYQLFSLVAFTNVLNYDLLHFRRQLTPVFLQRFVIVITTKGLYIDQNCFPMFIMVIHNLLAVSAVSFAECNGVTMEIYNIKGENYPRVIKTSYCSSS